MIVRQLDLGQAATTATPAPAQQSVPTIAELERALRDRPRDVNTLLDLAELHRRDRAYSKARADYARVIALNGMNSAAWADYADVLGSLAGGRLNADATRAIDRSLALDPANPKALWLKATAAYQDHRYADALAAWKTLRATLPADSSDVKIVDANIAEASQLAGASSQPVNQAGTPKGG